jgi:hypothetical protein
MTKATKHLRATVHRRHKDAESPGERNLRLHYYGPAAEQPDIIITSYRYRLFFCGSVWHSPYLAASAGKLAPALDAALNSEACSSVMKEYAATPIGATATAIAPPHVITAGWVPVVRHRDLAEIGQKLMDEGLVPVDDLGNYAMILVLPPGTILYDATLPGKPPQSSMSGLVSAHGVLTLVKDGKHHDVYFVVSVWADGSNGYAVPASDGKPAWEPWENTVAALYNESWKVMCCKNIHQVPLTDGPCPDPDGKPLGWLMWHDDFWAEIGDLPMFYSGSLPQKAYAKGTSATAPVVPITLQWSNAKNRPHLPDGFVPQVP